MKPILISVTVLLISTGLVKGGRYAGEKIGAFEGGGGSYSGKITDPYAKKTYSGTIRVSADTVTLKGCVMKVVCESQKWSLQQLAGIDDTVTYGVFSAWSAILAPGINSGNCRSTSDRGLLA